MALIDWDGRLRMNSGALELLQFDPASDVQTLLGIRNDDSVRPFMPSHEPVSADAHMNWVKQNLCARNGPLLLIARVRTRSCGFVVLKPYADKELELGLMFIAEAQGSSAVLRSAVLAAGFAFERLHAEWLCTYVNPRHERALVLNRGMGLREVASDKPGELRLRISRLEGVQQPAYRRYWRPWPALGTFVSTPIEPETIPQRGLE